MKHLYEFIKDSFNKEGYELISESYNNGNQKLEYKCSIGHLHFVTYYNWHSGISCPTCSVDKKRINTEHIRAFLLSEGFWPQVFKKNMLGGNKCQELMNILNYYYK